MRLKLLFITLLQFLLINVYSQTTDLAIVVEAQNLNGADVSQVHIFETFQYIITISNSGNNVSNASFSIQLDSDVTMVSYESINASGGAPIIPNEDFNLTGDNLLSAMISTMPNNSSLEIRVELNAPNTLGGISANATIFSPSSIQDTNLSNNQSIISIDVTDLEIDFTVTHTQVSPPEGTPITAWGDTVTYEFTITNNSDIAYPLSGFEGKINLSSDIIYGRPVLTPVSLSCLSGTNGMTCLTDINIPSVPILISSEHTIFDFNTAIEFPSGGSLTFEVVYQYLEPTCGLELQPIDVKSYISLVLDHSNESSNNSNLVTTNLIIGELCDLTDICIDTIQIDPAAGSLVNWGEQITFETTFCNNGPLDAPSRFFLQNLTPSLPWEIISLQCLSTTGDITCLDFILSEQGQVWTSNTFIMPADATITIETVIFFNEPECTTMVGNTVAHVRSGTNLLSVDIIDSNIANNTQSDYINLPQVPVCPTSDLQITKTQISPALPEGNSPQNTTVWGSVTYEITATNTGNSDTQIVLTDFIPSNANLMVDGTLISVECVSTTGTATCFPINNAYIGIPHDSQPEDGNEDVFWEILEADNWILPGQSSVTFLAVVDWSPECSINAIPASNKVTLEHIGSFVDPNTSNNEATVITYFAPCIDLVVQTFPEFSSVVVNQSFDWIIDITNSATSSNAIDIAFEDVLNPVFTINGLPSCSVTSGSATCIPSFDITNNIISGIIPSIDAGSTIRIRIPVIAPNFGGAFNNIAEAIPNSNNNEEITPDTNISINSVQVLAPTLSKSFNPETIIVGQESILTFTVVNLSTNPSQNGISFTDNLPPDLFLSGPIIWVEDNGCTATFSGNTGDNFVTVTDLSFPSGVTSCTFSVTVTSDIAGVYINNHSNFSNQNNIDTSQASATLNVVEDTSNVDIEVLKDVFPQEVSLGDTVQFTITITNLGTTVGNQIEIFESLPIGYQYISSNSTSGVYDSTSFIWSVDVLNPNQSETLTIEAQVISSNNLLNTAYLQALIETDRNETNNQDTAEVELDNCLTIPQGISPNDDAKNDFLVIPCIEDYENNQIKIYNRLGVLIYESKNYQNDWNGYPNKGFPLTDKRLPVGTYFYILEVDSSQKPIIGWVYLSY